MRGSYQGKEIPAGACTQQDPTGTALIKATSYSEGLVLDVPGPVSSFEVW